MEDEKDELKEPVELKKPIEDYDEELQVATEIITEFDPEMILEIIENYCETKKADEEASFDMNEDYYKAKITYPHIGLKMKCEVLKMQDN